METDVAAFARQLKQDGIDAARAEAARITGAARAEAEELLLQARAAADKLLRDARSDIEGRRQRQRVEIQLAARDTMLEVKEAIERVVMLLLRHPIGEALETGEIVRTAIAELIRNSAQGEEWEVRAGPRIGTALVQAAVNELSKGRRAAVTLIEELAKSGLEFRNGAGEVLELSEDSVREIFRRLVSPELNRLLAPPPD